MRSTPGTSPVRPSAAPLPAYWAAALRPTPGSGHTAGLGLPAATPFVAAPEATAVIDVSHRFGIRLRALRCERNLTQQDMARRFGIDRSFISDVERGRKSISLVTLEILALGLGVSISELLSDV